jgi:hypothetical protein
MNIATAKGIESSIMAVLVFEDNQRHVREVAFDSRKPRSWEQAMHSIGAELVASGENRRIAALVTITGGQVGQYTAGEILEILNIPAGGAA